MSMKVALLGFIEKLFDVRGLAEVDFEDGYAIGARVSRTLDVPTLHVKRPRDLSSEEASGSGHDHIFTRHIVELQVSLSVVD